MVGGESYHQGIWVGPFSQISLVPVYLEALEMFAGAMRNQHDKD